MSGDLAKRWWWQPKPERALRRAFPQITSEVFIRRSIWPDLQQAAKNYELASRAEGKRPRYLLGKPFHELSEEQMRQVASVWPRPKQRQLLPNAFEIRPYGTKPSESEELRAIYSEAQQESVVLSPETDTKRFWIERTKQREKLERYYSHRTGWTVPRLFEFNLRECSDRKILDAVKAYLEGERKWLGVAGKKSWNKGRANRSSKRGISFHDVEALDAKNLLPPHERPHKYDMPQAGKAKREAKRLRAEWEARRS